MDEQSFVMIAGGSLILAGIALLARARLFRARAIRTSGRITGIDLMFVENASNIREATVEFTTEDGREVTAKAGDIGSRRLREGSPVTVLYDPRKPTVAYVDGTSMRGGWVGGVLIGMGLCFALSLVLVRLFGPEGAL